MVHRERGYRSAMKELGLSRAARVVFVDQSRASIRKQASTISTNNTPRSGPLLDGFVAFEVLSVARELGLHVPGDVAIMGHDTAFCELSIASMTSIDQSGAELGANAARLLIERIEGRTKSVFVTVAPKVEARGSTKMPRVEIAAQSKITGTEDIERFPRPRDRILGEFDDAAAIGRERQLTVAYFAIAEQILARGDIADAC